MHFKSQIYGMVPSLQRKMWLLQAVEKAGSPTELVEALLHRPGVVKRHWDHFTELQVCTFFVQNCLCRL